MMHRPADLRPGVRTDTGDIVLLYQGHQNKPEELHERLEIPLVSLYNNIYQQSPISAGVTVRGEKRGCPLAGTTPLGPKGDTTTTSISPTFADRHFPD